MNCNQSINTYLFGSISLGIILLCLTFCSCNKQDETTELAFYHWKQDLTFSSTEQQYFSELSANRIYLRFFDVDWQGGQAVPLSILNTATTLPDSIELIPTVFITNRTFQNISEIEISLLSEKVIRLITQLEKSFPNQHIPEVQFDCDWSESTQQAFFYFIQKMKTSLTKQNRKISTTIRLHQIKYFEKTGVPDVDRGVLMFYNMGKVDDWESQNSILDIEIAKSYLTNFDRYPLPLDIALPIFKWGIVFRDKQFNRIINNIDTVQLQDTSRFYKIDEKHFELRKSTYLNGYYLSKHDHIRLEKVSNTQLQASARLLAKHLKKENRHLIFYHLDSTIIVDYPYETLETIHHTISQ